MTRAEKRAARRAAHVNAGARNRGNGLGYGGDAKGSFGPGWGGPAKGASVSRLSESGDDYSDAIRALAHDPRHKEAKAQMRALVLQTWVRVAQKSDNDSAAVAAAVQLAKRTGLPEEPAVNINLNRDDLGDLTDEQLAAEIRRLRDAVEDGAGSDASAGDGAPEAGEPPGVLPPV